MEQNAWEIFLQELETVYFLSDLPDFVDAYQKKIKDWRVQAKKLAPHERVMMEDSINDFSRRMDNALTLYERKICDPADWVVIEQSSDKKMYAMELETGVLIRYGEHAPMFIPEQRLFEADNRWYLRT